MIKWVHNGIEFKVGDTVKVVRKPSGIGGCMGCMGYWEEWESVWVEDMDASVGKTFTIDNISHAGVQFVECVYSYPLPVLEKLILTTIPPGDFLLVGRGGIVYSARPGVFTSGGLSVSWAFKEGGSVASTIISPANVIKAIDSGFWSVTKTKEQAEKEARLEALETQQIILTNEIEQLEKEIAQW